MLMNARYDFCPWVFWGQAGPEEQQAQLAHQADVAATGRARFGERCYLSPVAGFVPDNVSLGDFSYIAGFAYVTGEIATGRHCTINPYALVRGKVTLGEGVRIGSHACLLAFNHKHDDLTRPIYEQGIDFRGIMIGDDVWIGSGSVILDGVTVGSHTIIGAGAVVTRDVPEWSVVAGNPARVLRDRRTPRPVRPAQDASPARILDGFARRVAAQWPEVLRRCESKVQGAARYLNAPGARVRTFRPNCDAIEIAASFGAVAPLLSREEWVCLLQDTQDPASGLPIDPFRPNESHMPLDALGDDNTSYQILSIGYALACLGAGFVHPIHVAHRMTVDTLHNLLAAQPWHHNAWGAGAWTDALGTAFWLNRHGFGLTGPVAPLFDWLRAHCQTHTGLWGDSTAGEGWLQPVNGFYRLTRGTYAQFGLPVPHPAAAIDTILAHTRLNGGFETSNVTACNVLDVVHPLWLCGRQTSHRREEIVQLMERQVRLIPERWVDGEGFSFSPENAPGLQGTEMWLSILYLAATDLGLADRLPYAPTGVHRLRSPEHLAKPKSDPAS